MSFSFKKRFGQNFLKNNNIIYKIIQAIPDKFTHIYEIGPGHGALTFHLLKKFAKVSAIEIDQDCINKLQEKFAQNNFNLIHQDILQLDLNMDCVIGNLPYNIGTKIIEKFLYNPIQCGVFMLQREVAQRIIGNDYGRLSVCVAARYEVSHVVYVSEKDFIPMPKVKSEVIKFIKHSKYEYIDMKILNEITKIIFKHPRKKINWIKKEHVEIANKLEILGVDFNLRPENIKQEIFFAQIFYQ